MDGELSWSAPLEASRLVVPCSPGRSTRLVLESRYLLGR